MKAYMPLFFLFFSFSTFASESEFCLAKREIIPYSPFEKFYTNCNGVEIREKSLFGRGLQEKFEKKLKQNGLNIFMKFGNALLISKRPLNENEGREICVAIKSQNMNRIFINCSLSSSVTLNSIKDADFLNYANSYNFQILQKPKKNDDFYVILRK